MAKKKAKPGQAPCAGCGKLSYLWYCEECAPPQAPFSSLCGNGDEYSFNPTDSSRPRRYRILTVAEREDRAAGWE